MKLSLRSKGENSQAFYNLFSTVVRTGVNFLTLPIFTHLLGTEQYGLYSVYLKWYNLINCFIALGLGQGLATGRLAYKDDYPKFRSSILLGGTLMSALTTGLAIALYPALRHVILLEFPIYVMLFLESASYFVTNFAGTAWIYEKKAANNMVLSLALLLCSTLLSLGLLRYWPGSPDRLYVGRVMGLALPNIAAGVIVWFLIFRQSPAGYNREYWRYSFSFGLPTIFHTLSHQVLTSSDVLMMQHFRTGDGYIGIYGFFHTFVAILNTLLRAFNNTWVPFLYDDLEKKNYEKLNRRVGNYTQVFTVLTCGFILLAREVAKLFAREEYWPGMPLVPLMALVMYSTFLYEFPVNYEFYKAKPKIIAYGTTGAAAVNILLNALMIPRWGMYGAGIATLISYFSLVLLHAGVVMLWKEERYPLTWKPLFAGFGAVAGTCGLFYLLADYWFVRWGLGAVLGLWLAGSVYRRKSIF